MDQGFIPTLVSQAMLTIPILDFQSNPAPPSPLWRFVKVRVQGSCVLCAHGPALFVPNPSPFFPPYCARMERCTTKVMDMDFLWFDSMKRSEEGTMKWQRGLHAALTGTRVLTSPWNGTGWAIQGPSLSRTRGGGGVPWAPVTLSCSHVALASLQQENRATVWGAERSCCVEPNFKE